ncbi:hypothetical protein [Sphingobium fuliginis]|uniref:hypothetical protein n=1 Tax=Sphingobium fuliginis (strain ATCC 27551) TaxID=336203 RepID=UPI001C3FCBD0|nr:hypothetical protein [Sphingobium fuliginis]
MVSNNVGYFDSARSEFLLVLLIEAFERDSCEIGRWQKKLQRRARSPSLVISVPRL